MFNTCNTVIIIVMRYINFTRKRILHGSTIFLKVLAILIITSCEQSSSIQLYTEYHNQKTVCFSMINKPYDIVFMGDSITEMGNFDKYIPDSINLGISGDYIWATNDVVRYAVKISPKKLYLMTGINSLKDYSLEESKAQYKALIECISKALPDTQIILESVLPHANGLVVISEFNSYIQQIAEEKGVRYLDLYSLYAVDGKMPAELTIDGLHLKPETYNIWYEVIRADLRKEYYPQLRTTRCMQRFAREFLAHSEAGK